MKGLGVCMNIEKKKDKSHFLLYDDFVCKLKLDSRIEFNSELLEKLIEKSLIVTVKDNDKAYIYEDDLKFARDIMHLNYKLLESNNDIGFCGSLLSEIIKIEEATFLCYDSNISSKYVPVLVRNIVYLFKGDFKKCERREYCIFGVTLITYNEYIANYIENALYRKHKLENIKSSNFSNSSSYMGSKKNIVGFIIESIWPHTNDDSIILDIMCGSGAVSNALAQMGNIYSSDSQLFCRLLAKIQGAGFNRYLAEETLNSIYECYMHNFSLLKNEYTKQLEMEKKIFHMDTNEPQKIFEEYEKYLDMVDLYSSTDYTNPSVLNKVIERKKDHRLSPYCLFTCYFANVYFGLEQCLQIDSIRYAIDNIEDENIREWALGVLVVTISSIASNHAGHFAQPKRVDVKSIVKINEKRKKSAWLEFSKRIVSIGAESERYLYNVNIINGPWEEALNEVVKNHQTDVIVYLDAPYKRDEYSRYYHVLETAVLYDYPHSENKGRVRSKTNGERFRTEFFSKNTNIVAEKLASTIERIMKKSSVCAWSYSNNAAASIPKVVDMILEKTKCNVYFHAIPHKHTSQRRKIKGEQYFESNIIEYCIIFVK